MIVQINEKESIDIPVSLTDIAKKIYEQNIEIERLKEKIDNRNEENIAIQPRTYVENNGCWNCYYGKINDNKDETNIICEGFSAPYSVRHWGTCGHWN